MSGTSNTPTRKLARLHDEIIQCGACPRLRAWCQDVAQEKKREFAEWDYWGKPVPGFGDPKAEILIVGLAPAAHGANRTGRMFTGDSSGDWLYDALWRSGLASQAASTHRDDGLVLRNCYITAAARCAPPNNRPTGNELDTCRSFLTQEIEALTSVKVVITLGQLGHTAWLKASGWWAALSPQERPRFGHGVVSKMGDDVKLISSYHPSRQNTNTGKLTRPMWLKIFTTAADWVKNAPKHGEPR